MQDFINRIRQLDYEHMNLERLGAFVYSYPFDRLSWRDRLPEAPAGTGYSRNILLMQPIEVALLRWPPGSKSAVHLHDGFYGYVVVLEGSATDRIYSLRGAGEGRTELLEQHEALCFPGGIIDEPDGALHQIINDGDREMISLHIYYPPLETFQGMRIYDLEGARIGTLSAGAQTATWSAEPGHFDAVEDDAFQFLTWPEAHPGKSHRIRLVKPKPDSQRIRDMIAGYYDEQAHRYDHFDFRHRSRKSYTHKINELVAGDLGSREPLGNMICIATGTGRRALEIRRLSGRDFALTGVDMSDEMVSVARERGLSMLCGSWMEVDLPSGQHWDAAMFLYAFGHIPTATERLAALCKVNACLRMGGVFYLDVFNLDDRFEWGPVARRSFARHRLDRVGYDQGDVFYGKAEGRQTAFVHYFTESELVELLDRAGFRVADLRYVGYVERSGEEVESADEGFFYVAAEKVRSC